MERKLKQSFFTGGAAAGVGVVVVAITGAVEPSNLNSPIKLPYIYFTLRSTFRRSPPSRRFILLLKFLSFIDSLSPFYCNSFIGIIW